MDKLFAAKADIMIGAEALNAYATGVSAAAHNLATGLIPRRDPVRADYADGMAGIGVSARVVSERARMGEIDSGPPALPVGGADFAKDLTRLILARQAFEGAATVVRVADENSGILINLKA